MAVTLPTFYWPEFLHVAAPSCKGVWEKQYGCVSRGKKKKKKMIGKPIMASVTCGITSKGEGRGAFETEETSGMYIPGSGQESRNHSNISGQAGLNAVTDSKDVRGLEV